MEHIGSKGEIGKKHQHLSMRSVIRGQRKAGEQLAN